MESWRSHYDVCLQMMPSKEYSKYNYPFLFITQSLVTTLDLEIEQERHSVSDIIHKHNLLYMRLNEN